MSSPNNDIKKDAMFNDMRGVLDRLLRKGYFGEVTFTIKIQDGAIQEIEKQEKEKLRYK